MYVNERPTSMKTPLCRLAQDIGAGDQRPPQSDLVSVLEIAAHRQACGGTGHAQSAPLHERSKLLRDVEGRSLAAHSGVGGHHDLGEVFGLHSFEELGEAQAVGADAVDGREGPAENVVEATY